MELIHGKPVAEKILAETKRRIEHARVTPGFVVILVGSDAASHLYVGLKERAAREVGIRFEKFLFPETADVLDILSCIDEQNVRPDIHGILVQLPLPHGWPTDEIIARIDPKKDTDGFHHESIMRFLSGDMDACPVFPRAIVELLRETGEELYGEKAIVLANSELLGKIMTQALNFQGLQTEYIVCTGEEQDVTRKAKEARVIVTARGTPNFITSEMISEHVIIIDGGISAVDGQVVGDVDRKSVMTKAAFLTPVPGGVGPVTVATLLARVTDAALIGIDEDTLTK